MHDAILDGKPPYLTLAETRDHVRTILALYESAAAARLWHWTSPETSSLRKTGFSEKQPGDARSQKHADISPS